MRYRSNAMTANELLRKLRALGAVIDPSHGKGGHVAVRLGKEITFVPVHGKRDLPIGTLNGILRRLGLRRADLP
jgi:predicted RNA binding protein YcfA (HicA-like mRNA interferase family)